MQTRLCCRGPRHWVKRRLGWGLMQSDRQKDYGAHLRCPVFPAPRQPQSAQTLARCHSPGRCPRPRPVPVKQTLVSRDPNKCAMASGGGVCKRVPLGERASQSHAPPPIALHTLRPFVSGQSASAPGAAGPGRWARARVRAPPPQRCSRRPGPPRRRRPGRAGGRAAPTKRRLTPRCAPPPGRPRCWSRLLGSRNRCLGAGDPPGRCA